MDAGTVQRLALLLEKLNDLGFQLSLVHMMSYLLNDYASGNGMRLSGQLNTCLVRRGRGLRY